MVSILQKLSDAVPSFTSIKEPKLVKRSSSHISTQPNDPATFPTAARMPLSSSSTSSSKDGKQRKGAKAKDFLKKHFSLVEADDDLVEVRVSQFTIRCCEVAGCAMRWKVDAPALLACLAFQSSYAAHQINPRSCRWQQARNLLHSKQVLQR